MEKNIFIIGEIGDAEKGYTYNQALKDYQLSKDADIINIYIDSPGGLLEEGREIAQLFKNSGKLIRTFNAGDVASVAMNIFLIANEMNRFYDPRKGQMLIHYPWTEVEGNADDLSEFAKTLKSQESELVKELKSILNVDEEVLRGYMKQERFLTTEEVQLLNIGKIVTPAFQAVAKLKQTNMNEVEVKKELGLIKNMLEGLKALFPAKVKALMIQDVNGVELDLPEIESIEQLVPELTVTVDGSAAEGEFTLEDGTVIVCTGGKVAEIRPPVEEDPAAAIQKENESLKAEIETLKNEATKNAAISVAKAKEFDEFKTKALKEIKTATESFETFKKKFSKDFIPEGGAEGGKPTEGENRSARKPKE